MPTSQSAFCLAKPCSASASYCGSGLAGDDLPFPVRVGRNQDAVIPMLFKKRNDASGRVFQRGGRLVDERLGNYGKVSPAFEQRAVRLRLGKGEQMSDAVRDDGLSVGTPVAFFRRRETATERGGEIFCHAGFFGKYKHKNLFPGRSEFMMVYDKVFVDSASSN